MFVKSRFHCSRGFHRIGVLASLFFLRNKISWHLLWEQNSTTMDSRSRFFTIYAITSRDFHNLVGIVLATSRILRDSFRFQQLFAFWAISSFPNLSNLWKTLTDDTCRLPVTYEIPLPSPLFSPSQDFSILFPHVLKKQCTNEISGAVN